MSYHNATDLFIEVIKELLGTLGGAYRCWMRNQRGLTVMPERFRLTRRTAAEARWAYRASKLATSEA